MRWAVGPCRACWMCGASFESAWQYGRIAREEQPCTAITEPDSVAERLSSQQAPSHNRVRMAKVGFCSSHQERHVPNAREPEENLARKARRHN